MKSQEQELNITIELERKHFESKGGIFNRVANGRLTELISYFTQNEASQLEFLQALVMQDEGGRTPLDIACYLNFKNVIMYLLTKYGKPQQLLKTPLNVDEQGRNAYHIMLYKGNYDALVTMMNYERACLRKDVFDELQGQK